MAAFGLIRTARRTGGFFQYVDELLPNPFEFIPSSITFVATAISFTNLVRAAAS